jgi:hypothetical protein
MHLEVLSSEQATMLPFIKFFKSKFYLVGGTAIALQIGHRKSIDFDLFCGKAFQISSIHKKVIETFPNAKTIHRSNDQIHYLIDGVKVTFFYYPFQVPATKKLTDIIKMPNLLSLAAMKAFALSRRAKWKDYIDLYFLLKYHFSIEEIGNEAKLLFGENFNTKLFKQQLVFFEDIDYTEEVYFLSGFEVSDSEVKSFLIEIATRDI